MDGREPQNDEQKLMDRVLGYKNQFDDFLRASLRDGLSDEVIIEKGVRFILEGKLCDP